MPVLVAPLTGLLMARIGTRNVVAIALAFQAAGMAWLAAVLTPSAGNLMLVPGFVLAGIGMGLFFPPAARLALGFAPAELAGVASGASNAVRQLGTVLGVAVLSAIFSTNGSMTGDSAFADGLLPVLWTGTAAVGAAVLIALIIPRDLPAQTPAARSTPSALSNDLAPSID
jgi:MFS family permease